MGAAADALLSYDGRPEAYDLPYASVLPRQVEALAERLAERTAEIAFLASRVEQTGVRGVRALEDIVPLLFAHTTYKSYPESWFFKGQWERMGRWLDSLSARRTPALDLSGVADVDDWSDRLAAKGFYLSSSSGTTGKCSLLPMSEADRAFNMSNVVTAFSWATEIAPGAGYKLFGMTPVPAIPRNLDSWTAIARAFACEDHPFPGEPITIGKVNRMVALRRSIAEGTAQPNELADFTATSAAREREMAENLQRRAEQIVASRDAKLLIRGMFGTMHQVCEIVRGMGCRAGDFHSENALIVAGGLKGASLPPDYRERILETFNIRPERIFHFYSMQELHTYMPRCRAGRYHVPPWLVLLVLDESGERLLSNGEGEAEGRAGFFDLSIDGRWGGVITGDRIRASFDACACGRQGPSIDPEITRYADLSSGDKITCAGTIDAYVRGLA